MHFRGVIYFMSCQELREKIENILSQSLPDRHTFFQIKNFIISKEHTHQGKLWAIYRELKSRKDSIESLVNDIDEARDRIDLLDIRINKFVKSQEVQQDSEESTESQEMAIEIRRLLRKKKTLHQSIDKLMEKVKYQQEEAKYLVDSFEALSKLEPMKPLDDVKSQKEYWDTKVLEEIKLRMLLGRPLDVELVKTALTLDNDSPVKKQIIGLLESQQKKLIEKNNG